MYSIHYVLAKLQLSYALELCSVRFNRFCIMNFTINDCMVELLQSGTSQNKNLCYDYWNCAFYTLRLGVI